MFAIPIAAAIASQAAPCMHRQRMGFVLQGRQAAHMTGDSGSIQMPGAPTHSDGVGMTHDTR